MHSPASRRRPSDARPSPSSTGHQLDPDTHRFFRRGLQAVLGDQTAWDEVGARLVQVYRPAIREGLGLDDSELAGFIRGVMEPMLTRPFGEASLATFLAAMQGQVAKAQ